MLIFLSTRVEDMGKTIQMNGHFPCVEAGWEHCERNIICCCVKCQNVVRARARRCQEDILFKSDVLQFYVLRKVNKSGDKSLKTSTDEHRKAPIDHLGICG